MYFKKYQNVNLFIQIKAIDGVSVVTDGPKFTKRIYAAKCLNQLFQRLSWPQLTWKLLRKFLVEWKHSRSLCSKKQRNSSPIFLCNKSYLTTYFRPFSFLLETKTKMTTTEEFLSQENCQRVKNLSTSWLNLLDGFIAGLGGLIVIQSVEKRVRTFLGHKVLWTKVECRDRTGA